MYNEDEVVLLDEGYTAPTEQPVTAEPNRLLQAQFCVCLFFAALLYFAWRQGGPLWGELSNFLEKTMEQGISFSGQENLTRFTDEVYDFWGQLVQAFAVQR